MNILFTGGSGFIGQNIISQLSEQYEIETIGLSDRDTYKIDLSKSVPVLKKKYDIVVHAAGKAHSVPKNMEESKVFFDVNVGGTQNLCAALEKTGIPDCFIFISSVAVYGLDSGTNITEEYPLNGQSPYAKSKIEAEKFLAEWYAQKNVRLGILRPSLIAGINPPGNLGAMISAIKRGRYLSIRGVEAKKSILMAEDIGILVPKISEKGGIYNVCDDHNPTFSELEILISSHFGKRKPLSVPCWIAKSMAFGGDIFGKGFPLDTPRLNKIITSLTFSNEKAKKELNWKPLDVLSNFRPG